MKLALIAASLLILSVQASQEDIRTFLASTRHMYVESYQNSGSPCTLSTTTETCNNFLKGQCCAKLWKANVAQTTSYACVPMDLHTVNFTISNVNYTMECNYIPVPPNRTVCTINDTDTICGGGRNCCA